MAADAPLNITARQQSSLRRWNIIAGFAHATQAVLILVLSSDFSLPVTSTYILGPPGTTWIAEAPVPTTATRFPVRSTQ